LHEGDRLGPHHGRIDARDAGVVEAAVAAGHPVIAANEVGVVVDALRDDLGTSAGGGEGAVKTQRSGVTK